MTEQMNAKRQALKELSRIAAQIVEKGDASTVNEALVMIYAEQGHTELHSFKKWLEQGYTVRKGEKALLLWAEPRKALNAEKKTDNEKDEFKFFPLAYVFSQNQVEPLKHLAT